jgi:hypothetical protein
MRRESHLSHTISFGNEGWGIRKPFRFQHPQSIWIAIPDISVVAGFSVKIVAIPLAR